MKLKVFDLFHRTLTSVLKEGFCSDVLAKECEMRLQPQWAFVPVLTLQQPNICREAILDGCTLDRLPLVKQCEADAEVGRILAEIQQMDRELVNGADYGWNIYRQIVEAMEGLQCEETVKTAIDAVALYLTKQMCGDITIAFSHGDFQKGNLLAGVDGNIYVLDWDTHTRRSLGYDLLTYFYSFRYRRDYWMRIDHFLQDTQWEVIATRYYDTKSEKRVVLSVYLLEDILWTLQECLATPERRPSDGMLRYAAPSFYEELRKRLERV